MSAPSVLDFNCVVSISMMNRAPPLPRSGGVGARYWERGGWVGMTKTKQNKTKQKLKKNKKKEEEKKGKRKKRKRKRRKTCSPENVL